MATPLDNKQIEEALETLEGWRYETDQLIKTFTFESFQEAVSFIVRLSFEAEAMNHHPEITNVYNRVTLALTTHDAGNQVTKRDLRLAKAIEKIAWV